MSKRNIPGLCNLWKHRTLQMRPIVTLRACRRIFMQIHGFDARLLRLYRVSRDSGSGTLASEIPLGKIGLKLQRKHLLFCWCTSWKIDKEIALGLFTQVQKPLKANRLNSKNLIGFCCVVNFFFFFRRILCTWFSLVYFLVKCTIKKKHWK